MSEIKPVTDVVEEYVAEYEWTDGEGNYYAPKDYERAMLADAIYGLIDADDFKQRHESALAQARREERERLADEAIEAQLSGIVFATSNECVAYNRALRSFADRILALDERTDEGEK